MEYCYLCERYGVTEIHHCLSGSYRQLADKYGLTVNLCPDCHRFIHSGAGAETKRRMAATAQQKAMERNGWTLEAWMRIFQKSWL